MGPNVNLAAAIFLVQKPAVGREQDRHRVRHQQDPGDQGSPDAIKKRGANSGVVEIHRIHQLMQGDVSVMTRHTRQRWNGQSQERGQRLVSETGKSEVEPDNVGLDGVQRTQNSQPVIEAIEVPAASDFEAWQFRLWRGQVVGQYCEAQQGILFQFPSDVEPVFIQASPAGRKGCH